MKYRKLILSIFSIILGVTFVIGSTGVTVILHSCSHCGDTSLHAGMFVSPEIPEDHCCEYAIDQCVQHDSQSIVGECCHFRIDKLKLTNYAPSGKVLVSIPVDAPFIYKIAPANSLTDNIIVPFAIHNKHGGRYVLTYNCQFIS